MQITEKQNEWYQGNMEILKNPLNAQQYYNTIRKTKITQGSIFINAFLQTKKMNFQPKEIYNGFLQNRTLI